MTHWQPADLAEVNPLEISRALHTFFQPGDRFEVRAFLPNQRSAGKSQCFGHAEIPLATDWARTQAERGKHVYWCTSPVQEGLVPDEGKAVKDVDVGRRRWLFLDIDAKREGHKKESATEDEKALAFAVAEQVRDFLREEHGWPAPVEADSGNGAYLLYPIDLPNDDASRDLVQAVLVELADRFDTEAVEIDTVCYNASRLAKVPGTLSLKGANSVDRPHRQARRVPSRQRPAGSSQLLDQRHGLAQPLDQPDDPVERADQPDDLLGRDDAQHDLAAAQVEPLLV